MMAVTLHQPFVSYPDAAAGQQWGRRCVPTSTPEPSLLSRGLLPLAPECLPARSFDDAVEPDSRSPRGKLGCERVEGALEHLIVHEGYQREVVLR